MDRSRQFRRLGGFESDGRCEGLARRAHCAPSVRAFSGAIGGGSLEWQALEAARLGLAAGGGAALRRTVALGPDLAQCCGGRVQWLIETFDARDAADLLALAAAERAGSFATEAIERLSPARRCASNASPVSA
jgi:xanthine/CO dehydrogenase XdhC/CoxF family maturation factor